MGKARSNLEAHIRINAMPITKEYFLSEKKFEVGGNEYKYNKHVAVITNVWEASGFIDVEKITDNAFTVEIKGILNSFTERIPFRNCTPTE